MSDFTKAYKFVQDWLWDCRKHGSERRTSGMPWGNEYCADAADMIVDFCKENKLTIESREE